MTARIRTAALFAALAISALSGAASATAAPLLSPINAPGRAALDVNSGTVAENVDGGSATSTVALPDGGALLIGSSAAAPYTVVIAHIDRAGKPAADVVRLDLSATKFRLLQALRRPDGRLLLAGTEPGADVTAGAQLVLVQLTPAGALDTSFGSGGFSRTGVTAGCGAVCSVMALTPDGRIVVTGYSGKINPLPAPGDYSAIRWVVAQRTADGAPDTSFGAGGYATFATPGAIGLNVAVLPDGRVVSDAQISNGGAGPTSMLLSRLTAAGAPDGTFNGGNPVTVPFFVGFPMLAQADGSVLLTGSQSTHALLAGAGGRVLLRYTPAGAPDPSFGSNGVVNLAQSADPKQLLPGPGNSTLLVSTVGVLQGKIAISRIARDGTADPALGGIAGFNVSLPFGGGGSSFLVSKLPRPLPSLTQNSFRGTQLVERPDGSYVIGDGVSVTTPTGEGAGRSIFRFAAASLTPAFALDPAFGGPAAPMNVKVSVALQRRTTAHTRHGIRVRLTASAPGLARVKIVAGGKTVAQSVVPIFKSGAQTLPVELTKTGNTLLRHSSRRLHVSVSVTARNLVATQGTAKAEGALH